MKFEETEGIITIPIYQNTFVYYLMKNNEVVYVGQTKKGLTRPLTHFKDKDFDEIKIQYCDAHDLDLLEDKMIKKYNPKYNVAINYSINYSLMRARNKIRERYNSDSFSLRKLKKAIEILDIKLYELNGTVYMNVDDYERIIKYIDQRLKEIRDARQSNLLCDNPG